MSKRMIGRRFVGSVATFAASILLLTVAFIVAMEQDVFIMNGPDVVGVRSGASTWIVVILGVLAVLLTLTSALGGLTAWLGALAATGGRADKTWFVVILLVGLLSIGFLATLFYLVAGPPDEPVPVAPSAVGAGQDRSDLVAH
jgi:hypothetical protein